MEGVEVDSFDFLFSLVSLPPSLVSLAFDFLPRSKSKKKLSSSSKGIEPVTQDGVKGLESMGERTHTGGDAQHEKQK